MAEENTTQYSEKEFLEIYEKKVHEHSLIVYPAVLKAMGNIKGKRVLDIGCGNGFFTNKLVELGAEALGIDNSEEWVRRCEEKYKKEKLSFELMDGTDLGKLKNESFDFVIINAVLLNIARESDVQKVLSESARVLKKSGVLMFSDLHPAIIMTPEYRNRKTKYSRDFTYFKTGGDYAAVVKVGDKEIEFTNKHWTLENYSDWLYKNKMMIYKILEPDFIKNSDPEFQNYKIPQYIYFCCKKF